ncbi:MAG: molybdopterin-dependent oxidoreductase [Rhodopseudomonas sp.]|uniref:nitrate reductase n=1 Tax=Rhodopseudomonas sp. TaxID=1078 RepID=UPI00185A7C23|nr:nitrate reductase [Rhodopseudomonas sp.]NVN87666.1 molybdopterin-dependent oxidoreductase [Rhodopseudomonas sp.]
MNALPQHPPAVRTTCAYCGVGCGILARPDGQGGATIAGDPDHPANYGRLCSKGSALGETLTLETRLLHPMLRQPDGALAQATWDEAIGAVASGFAETIAKHGPDSVAFYLSGQLLTEDYYVANKLMKGFLGSGNVDTNSRLCMASSVTGHRRAFGTDTVPGSYADLDEADLIVLVGSNAAWCHPVLYQRMLANKRARGAKIVVIDPRRTATVEDDDLFLPVAPGMDTALFSGLLVHLADALAFDYDYIEAHTTGLTEALVRAREIAPDLAATARAAGIAEADVARFFDLFRTTQKVVTCYSQGVNQSAQGTDKVNAIINCHLVTGRIGKPGMGPFSLTGQPNAMGGREVGGLANQLAAHMDFSRDNIDRVGRFWRASNMAQREGHKAVQMFEAIARGEIKALWVMATNPAVSLPRAGAVRAALQKLDLLVISDNVASNDSINCGAHVLLPAAGWGEKDGTVTNSERRISRQRPFLPLPGQARSDWWIVSQVAQRMGFADAFTYDSAGDVFREHAALSAFENNGARDFDLGALAALSEEQFNALDPVQWPARAGQPLGESRFFADGGFFTPDRKARLIAPQPPAPRAATSAEFPLTLNTGRIRDQWHTMTRSGLSPRLGAHLPEPFVELHPRDAEAFGLSDGGFAQLTTGYGKCVLKVVLSDGQRPGSLFAPIHWSNATASSARVGELVTPATDPLSGQPEAKATPCAIAPLSFAFRGFALARHKLTLPDGTWWSRVAVGSGSGLLFASNDPPAAWRACAAAMFGADVELAEYVDEPRQSVRVAAFVEGRMVGCLFVGPAEAAPQWDAVKALFESEALGDAQRRAALSGKSTSGLADPGPVVCACFGVGLNTIRAAIESGEATSAETIGVALRAGTNCGSCLPELRKIASAAKVATTA